MFNDQTKTSQNPTWINKVSILYSQYPDCISVSCLFFDEDINTIVTPTPPAAIHTGPITRARTRQLNYQVLLFLGNDSNVHENMMLPKLDTFVLLTKMKGLAGKRGVNTGARSSMEMMACAMGTRTELQVMISGL